MALRIIINNILLVITNNYVQEIPKSVLNQYSHDKLGAYTLLYIVASFRNKSPKTQKNCNSYLSFDFE